MNNTLQISKSISINSPVEKVWNVLTTPEKLKLILNVNEVVTTWNVGNSISFKGNYKGHVYIDKGIILEFVPHQILSYSYWSGFSGLKNKPENYATVTYTLEKISNQKSTLTWSQIGFSNNSSMIYSNENLPQLLKTIKIITETI